MKILVTGGAGFIGSHIVERLLEEKVEVIVLDNFSGGSIDNLPSGFPYIEMDIRDPEIIPWMQEQHFDYVVHQAAQISVPKSIESPLEDGSINIAGLLNLLEGARLSNVKRFIFASSAAVYGNVHPQDLPIREVLPKEPLSFYGLTKWTGEQYLNLYWQTFGLEYVALRYANVFGERQGAGGEGGVIDIFCKAALKGEPLTLFGDGTQTRDFIYVKDVAQAVFQAILTSFPNRAYNISTQTETTLNELIEKLEEIEEKSIPVCHLEERAGDIRRSVLSIRDTCDLLEWSPQTSLKEGLTNLMHSLRKNQ